MRLPRSPVSASGDIDSRSCPRKRSTPARTFAARGGSSPITASEVTDLPQPDSPTRHSVCPASIPKDTPSMRSIGWPRKRIDRFSTLRTGSAGIGQRFQRGLTQQIFLHRQNMGPHRFIRRDRIALVERIAYGVVLVLIDREIRGAARPL